MPEKKRPEKRGDVQTEQAHENEVQTEERIREENPKDIPDESPKSEGSNEAGGEESKHGRKQKGNSDGT